MPSFPLSIGFDVGESFDALDVFLEKLGDAVERILQDQAQAAEAEQWEEGYEEQSYLHQLLQETLPRTLRYSTVLHAHAALDALLSRLCDHVQKRLGLRFSRSDMANARELPTRITYLRKALGDVLPTSAFSGGLGAKLRAFSRVRNIIAHAGGELSDPSPEDLKTLEQLGLGLTGGYIDVPPGAVSNLLGEARNWAEEACRSIENALPKVG